MILSKKIKENIPKISKEKDFSLSRLEREAGLHKNFISNLLASDTKLPKIDAMVKIADTLGVSIDELVGRAKESLQIDNNIILDTHLFQDCATLVIKLLLQKKLEINFSKFINAVKEIYMYCLVRNEKKLDTEFAEWFIDRSL